MIDPVALTQALIRCPSVTPADAGALGVVQAALEGMGFTCRRMPFSQAGTPDVDNLYARLGKGRPFFGFAGHTDVVPVGQGWTMEPFGGQVIDGALYGRGAADMKGGIAAFIAAVSRFLDQGHKFNGSIGFLITGDEEGPGINGTKKMLQTLDGEGVRFDHCLVGEPTNPTRLGQAIKIGRRGSLNAWITVHGTQGHTAYPHLADNAASRLARMIVALDSSQLDRGTDHFEASTIAVSTIDVGNPTTNIIPARATACLNIRFNDAHSGTSVTEWLRQKLDAEGGDYDLKVEISGESFLTPPGRLSDLISSAIQAETGQAPELSTSGGTSDARFIKDYGPVAEFGPVGASMHKADERISLADLEALPRMYQRGLDGYFGPP